MRPLHLLFILVVAFALGVGGGVWAQAVLLPSMAADARFADFQFIKDWNARTTVVRPVTQVTVNEAEGLVRAVERSREVVVGVKSVFGAASREGSGLVVTSDGLVVTSSFLVPSGWQTSLYIQGQDDPTTDARVIKRDATLGLALLKVEREGLPTRGFASENDTKLGASVFVSGVLFEQGELRPLVNMGIVKALSENEVRTTMFNGEVTGSPLFTVEGKVAGLAKSGPGGEVTAVPASALRDFLGL